VIHVPVASIKFIITRKTDQRSKALTVGDAQWSVFQTWALKIPRGAWEEENKSWGSSLFLERHFFDVLLLGGNTRLNLHRDTACIVFSGNKLGKGALRTTQASKVIHDNQSPKM